MKKISILLILALLLCLAPAALAEGGVQVEVMIADGASVVMLTPETLSMSASDTYMSGEGFALPGLLVRIEEEAFAGIPAKRIELTGNVDVVGKNAFANCPNLREFVIPECVAEIDPEALAGCTGVTVYGYTDTARAFAEAAGFDYVDANEGGTGNNGDIVLPVAEVFEFEAAPVVLPFVKR
jgi:hypothetical protein